VTIEDGGIENIDVWSGAIATDATDELTAATEAWAEVIDPITDTITMDLTAAERIWRDLITRLEGEAELSADHAAVVWDALESRWEKEVTSALGSSYQAIVDMGGTPNVAMPYIDAALTRNDPIQDSIDQLYSQRGQLVAAADPVDPFAGTAPSDSATSTSSAGAAAAVAGVPVAGTPSDSSSSNSSDSALPIDTVPPIPDPVYTVPDGCVQHPVTGIWGRWIVPFDAGAFGTYQFIEDATCIPVLVPPVTPPPPPDVTSPPAPPTSPPPAAPPPYAPPPASAAQCCPPQTINVTSPPVGPLTVNLPLYTPPPPAVYPTPKALPTALPEKIVSWDDTGRCANNAALNQENDPVAFAATAGDVVKTIFDMLRPTADTSGAPVSTAIIEVVRKITDSLGDAGKFLMNAGIGTFTIMSGVETILNPAGVLAALPSQAVAAWLGRIIGGPWEYLAQGKLYDIQYSAPQFLPSQAEVDAMYITSRIDDGLWECYTRAHGNLPNTRRIFRDTQTLRPSAGEEIQLEMRGINTPAATDSQLKQLGALSSRDRDAFRLLAQYIPGAGDLIRFMLRDSFDPVAVAAGGFDQEFEDKFTNSPQAQKIAKANGIDEATMRLFWRAHWNIPSYTQLTECLHRLRPGRAPDGVNAVTADEVENALKIDDMAPTWVKRMMAVSYNTITRTDIQQFFNDGTMEMPEVVERLQDNGYNAADAKRIGEAWDSIRVRRQSNIKKVFTTAKVAKEYIGGGLNYDEANLLLTQTGLSGSQAYDTLKQCDVARSVVSRNKCIKGVRTRFLRGEFDDTEATVQLIDIGMDANQADTIVAGWSCENISRDKQATIQKLQQWFHRGTLSKDDVYDRLVNLHYKPADAENMILSMILTEDEKRDQAFKSAFNERLTQAKKLGKLTAKQKKWFAEEIDMLETAAGEKLEAAKQARKRFSAILGGETRRNNAGTRAETVRAGVAGNEGEAGYELSAPIPQEPIDAPAAEVVNDPTLNTMP